MKALIAAVVLGLASLSANAACMISVSSQYVINADSLLYYYQNGDKEVLFQFEQYHITVPVKNMKEYLASLAKAIAICK